MLAAIVASDEYVKHSSIECSFLCVMMLKWHLERDWDQDLHRPGPAMAGHQTHPGPVSSEAVRVPRVTMSRPVTGGPGGPEDE